MGTEETARRARCLIVDDEAPAREELRFLLQSFPQVQVIGEATNAEEAALLIDSVDYDIVLLDIRMPGGSGLELAQRLREGGNQAAVIFTTAYPDHAVDAFDLAAVDYLVKPFDEQRLGRALRRALNLAGSDPDDPPPRGVDQHPPPVAPRIPIQHADRTVLVESDEIYYATASRGYSYLKLANDRVLTTYTLADLEQRLGDRFFRCHRSHLVHLHHVRELVSDYQGGLVLIMDDDQHSRIEVSRRQAAALRRQLGI